MQPLESASTRELEEDPRPRVLVIEDDSSLSHVICSFLHANGYACTPAYSGTEALLATRLSEIPSGAQLQFDIVLCDLMLPGMSGEDFIQTVRTEGVEVPIIVLSAKGLLDDRITVLRTGANDYLVKPFAYEELLARIEVQLRRTHRQGGLPSANTLSFGRWTARTDSRTFLVDGKPIGLTGSEFDIIVTLIRNPGRAFARCELLDEAYQDGGFHDEGTVRTHICNIRSKLKGTGTEGYIETVWGFGFRLTESPS